MAALLHALRGLDLRESGGHHLSRLDQPDASGRRQIAVLHGDEAVHYPVAPHLLHRRGHGARGHLEEGAPVEPVQAAE